MRAEQPVARDRVAELPGAAREHRGQRGRIARGRRVAGVCRDHQDDPAERSEREPEHALADVERAGRDPVGDHEDRADHEAGQAAGRAERAEERGQPDDEEAGDRRRRHAVLDRGGDRHRRAAGERGAGAPADPLRRSPRGTPSAALSPPKHAVTPISGASSARPTASGAAVASPPASPARTSIPRRSTRNASAHIPVAAATRRSCHVACRQRQRSTPSPPTGSSGGGGSAAIRSRAAGVASRRRS